MAKTFACPHCDASYRALPTLVGRKVRCSSCRNVFQLQHTGVAIKVEVAPKAEPAAKKDAPVQKKQQEKAPSSKQSRPQTRAIRKKQDRIAEMRKSLSGLAAAADEGVTHTEPSEALEPRDSSKSSAKVKAASGKKPAASSGKLNKKSSQKKSLRDSHYVQLTHTGEREQKARKTWVLLALVLSIVLASAIWFAGQRSPVEVALDAFVSPVASSENRLEQYQKRLWRPYRINPNDIPIVLNVDEAQIGDIERYDWTNVMSFLSNNIDTMQIHERFPLWIAAKDVARVDELWESFTEKLNIAAFYTLLKVENIHFVKLQELPTKMAASGMPKWLVYSLSMLLSPGLEPSLNKDLFGDSFPLDVQACLLVGVEGHSISDQNGYVDVNVLPEYQALMIGFSALGNAEGVEWRLLDLRYANDFSYYYAASENPLYLSAKKMEALIRQQAIVEQSRAEEQVE